VCCVRLWRVALKEIKIWVLTDLQNPNRDLAAAEKIANELLHQAPKNLKNKLILIDYYLKSENRDNAIVQLEGIKVQEVKAANFIDQIRYIEVTYYGGFIDRAIEILEEITYEDQQSEMSELLLKAYRKSGKLGKTLNLVNKLLISNPAYTLASSIKAEILYYIGDWEGALKTMEEVSIHQDYTLYQTALYYFQNNKQKEARKYLLKLHSYKNLGESEQDMFIYLCLHLNLFEHLIGLSFNELINAEKEGQVIASDCIRYVSIWVSIGQLIEGAKFLNKFYKSVEIQEADKVYLIQNLDTQNIVAYSYDQVGDAILNRSFIDKFKEKPVGHIVKEENIIKPKMFKLLEIKHKWQYLLHYIQITFSNKFPEESRFYVFKTEQDLSKDFLTTVDTINETSKEDFDSIQDLYLSQQIPLQSFSDLINRTVIATWSHLAFNENLPVYSSLSNLEILSNYQLNQNSNGATADLTFLLTQFYLNDKSISDLFRGKWLIPRSILEEIQAVIDETAFALKDGKRFLSSEGFVRVSKKEVQKEYQKWVKFRRWVLEHCKVVPLKVLMDEEIADNEKIQVLEKLLSRSAFQTALLAYQHNTFLLTEDAHFRRISSEILHLNSSNTSELSQILLNKNKLKIESHASIIQDLCIWGYKHTSVNHNVIVQLLEKDNWIPSSEIKKVLQMLSESHVQPAITVCLNTVYALYNKPLSEVTINTLTHMLLDYTFRHPKRMVTLELLLKELTLTHPYDPIFQKWMSGIIGAYAKS